MDILSENRLNLFVAEYSNNKFKQREALENAYTNFVEPYVNQLIEVNSQPLPTTPVAFPCFCCASVWLLLTLLYCLWAKRNRVF
jgi:hypothetical protein